MYRKGLLALILFFLILLLCELNGADKLYVVGSCTSSSRHFFLEPTLDEKKSLSKNYFRTLSIDESSQIATGKYQVKEDVRDNFKSWIASVYEADNKSPLPKIVLRRDGSALLDSLKLMLKKSLFQDDGKDSSVTFNQEICTQIGAKELLRLCLDEQNVYIDVPKKVLFSLKDAFEFFDPGIQKFFSDNNSKTPIDSGIFLIKEFFVKSRYPNLSFWEKILCKFDGRYRYTRALIHNGAPWVTIRYSHAFRRNLLRSIFCCMVIGVSIFFIMRLKFKSVPAT